MRFAPPPVVVQQADGTPVLELTLESGVLCVRLLVVGAACVDADDLCAAIDALLAY